MQRQLDNDDGNVKGSWFVAFLILVALMGLSLVPEPAQESRNIAFVQDESIAP